MKIITKECASPAATDLGRQIWRSMNLPGKDPVQTGAFAMIAELDEIVGIAHLREVCGKRLNVIWNPAFPRFGDLDLRSLSEALDDLAWQWGAEIIQIEVQPDSSFPVLPGYWVGNMTFYWEPIFGLPPVPKSKIEIGSDYSFESAAQELWTAVSQAGSTAIRYNNISTIFEEYAAVTSVPGLELLSFRSGKRSSAFVILDRKEKRAQVAFLWVSPEERGAGLGAQLIAGVIHQAVKQGISTVRYFVSNQNPSAIRLLLQSGFKPRTLVWNKFLD